MVLLIVGVIVFLLNLPFGFWRSKVRKFSLQWFLAIHAPVPLVYAIRIYAGIGWHLTTFPVLIGSFFLGQFVGNRVMKGSNVRRPTSDVSAFGGEQLKIKNEKLKSEGKKKEAEQL